MKLLNITKAEKETNDFILTVEHRPFWLRTEVQYYASRRFVMNGSEKKWLDDYVVTLLPNHIIVSDTVDYQVNTWVNQYRKEQKGKI